jgi:phenylpropionate dioxygenase-like ring-hydroxylating dioxygenase large terminal subunit
MVTVATSGQEMAAGGSNPDYFDSREVWYPVFYVEDLDKAKPTPFTLLGRDIVIWWDIKAECWRAFDDKCPHRLAPLSEGRIAEDGLLECPYHGWAFTGDGRCDRIPQQVEGGSAETSKRACVASLPTTVRQGLLFVYPGNPENAEKTKVPIVEPIEETPDEWIVLNTFRDLPYDAFTLLENVLDASHVPFTHHNTVGNRANASPVELEVLESGKHGFKGTWAEGPRKGKLGRQDTTFIAPGLMWHDLTSKQYGRTMTVVYATPIRKGECRLFARFPFKFASKIPGLFIKLTPRWYSHIGQNAILEDDQIFLHYQERYLEKSGGGDKFAKGFYLPTKADAFVFEFRQWIQQFNAEPFPGEALPPRLSKSQLLDRYNSHTKHCASCSKALVNIQKLRQGVAVAAVVVWALMPLFSVFWDEASVVVAGVISVVSLALGGAWLGLGRLERKFYEGREVAPRNLPDKKK